MLVYEVTRDILDDNGVQHVEVRVRLTQAEADAMLAEYDPQYGATPGVTLCRPLTRAVCAALLEDT